MLTVMEKKKCGSYSKPGKNKRECDRLDGKTEWGHE